jgi:hypothetical protein
MNFGKVNLFILRLYKATSVCVSVCLWTLFNVICYIGYKLNLYPSVKE